MSGINLVTKYAPYVDEMFTKESKRELLTNKDFNWDGAKTIKIHKVSTVETTDYDRAGTGENSSRYGAVQGIDNDIETMTLTKDRSFTFAIDKMDIDETGGVLEGASALAREVREVVIPEIDSHTYGVMCTDAGTKPTAKALTASNIYDEIIKASQELDDNLVPETGRCLVVTPATYYLMKKSTDIVMNNDIGADMRARGVISNLDGLAVIKVPAVRLPEKFGFMVCHKIATVNPVKLADYKVHKDPPGISGHLVEGRFYFDAFVLENKAKAIYYQATT